MKALGEGTEYIRSFHYPTNVYLFKVIDRNTRKRCETWSKLTINRPERHH